MSEVIRIETPNGPGELLLDAAGSPEAALLLGHGAGGGIDTWDLTLLAGTLPALGVSVARYRQPWLVAGRRVAGNPASLDRGWVAALTAVRGVWPDSKLFVGGRSAGARSACRCFDSASAGLVLLSFPLHPPGKPQSSRISELAAVAAPALVVQGDRDPFGSPDEIARALAEAGGDARIVSIAGTHSLGPAKSTPEPVIAEREQQLVVAVDSFVRDVLG